MQQTRGIGIPGFGLISPHQCHQLPAAANLQRVCLIEFISPRAPIISLREQIIEVSAS
jgi:hypothetical protein